MRSSRRHDDADYIYIDVRTTEVCRTGRLGEGGTVVTLPGMSFWAFLRVLDLLELSLRKTKPSEHPEVRDPAAGMLRIAFDAAIVDPRAELTAIGAGPVTMESLPKIARAIAAAAGAWTHVGAVSRHRRSFELARDSIRAAAPVRLWGTPPAVTGDPYRESPPRRVVLVNLGFVSRYPLVNTLTSPDPREVTHALDSLAHPSGFDVLAAELSWNPEYADRTLDPADLAIVEDPPLLAVA